MIEITAALISTIGSLGAAFFTAYFQMRRPAGMEAVSSPATISLPRIGTLPKGALAVVPLAVVVGGAVFALTSQIREGKVEPLRVPSGFSAFTWDAGEIGLALPEDWQELPSPLITTFEGEGELDFAVLITQAAEEAELRHIEADPSGFVDEYRAHFEQINPYIQVTGGPTARFHLGRPGFMVPIVWAFPGQVPINGSQYYILDFENSRFVVWTYPDNPIMEQLISTLNLG
jgi:hypothetical protein